MFRRDDVYCAERGKRRGARVRPTRRTNHRHELRRNRRTWIARVCFVARPGFAKTRVKTRERSRWGFRNQERGVSFVLCTSVSCKKVPQVSSAPLPVSGRARGHFPAASTRFCYLSGALFPTPDSSSPAGLRTPRDAPLYMATKTHTTF